MSDNTNHAVVGLAELQADAYVARKYRVALYAIACALERLEYTRREIEGAIAARVTITTDVAHDRIEIPVPDWSPGFREIAMPAARHHHHAGDEQLQSEPGDHPEPGA